jgi:hypothetical protein
MWPVGPSPTEPDTLPPRSRPPRSTPGSERDARSTTPREHAVARPAGSGGSPSMPRVISVRCSPVKRGGQSMPCPSVPTTPYQRAWHRGARSVRALAVALRAAVRGSGAPGGSARTADRSILRRTARQLHHLRHSCIRCQTQPRVDHQDLVQLSARTRRPARDARRSSRSPSRRLGAYPDRPSFSASFEEPRGSRPHNCPSPRPPGSARQDDTVTDLTSRLDTQASRAMTTIRPSGRPTRSDDLPHSPTSVKPSSTQPHGR